MSALHWLFKEEVAHSKLNSILELAECLGVEKVEHFKKRSSRVFRKLLLILRSQVKENLLKRIKKSPFFGILKDEVAEIANIKTLHLSNSTMKKMTKAETPFIDSTDLLRFSETNAAKTINNILINLISRLEL